MQVPERSRDRQARRPTAARKHARRRAEELLPGYQLWEARGDGRLVPKNLDFAAHLLNSRLFGVIRRGVVGGEDLHRPVACSKGIEKPVRLQARQSPAGACVWRLVQESASVSFPSIYLTRTQAAGPTKTHRQGLRDCLQHLRGAISRPCTELQWQSPRSSPGTRFAAHEHPPPPDPSKRPHPASETHQRRHPPPPSTTLPVPPRGRRASCVRAMR